MYFTLSQKDSDLSAELQTPKEVFLENSKERAPNFLESTAWPPSSPDLNPFDYHVWKAFGKTELYAGKNYPFKDLDELKTAAKEAWRKLSQDTIRKAVLQWLFRVTEVAKNQGGHVNTFG